MTYNAVVEPGVLLGEELVERYRISRSSGKVGALVFYFVLLFSNYLYHRKRIEEYERRFAGHPMNKWFKLWMLYFIALFLMGFPLLLFKIRGHG